jgi:alpha 1,3-glucosidase
MFPKDPNGFDLDDQFFIGSSGLLVKPVTVKDATETTVYIPEDEVCCSDYAAENTTLIPAGVL